MQRDRRDRALETCLQRLQAGENLEQVLGAHPRWYSEFRPILLAAQAAQLYANSIQVPELAQSQGRATFLEAAGEMIPKRMPARRGRGARLGLILLGLVLALSILAFQSVRLSNDTLPGDLLYPLKIFEEQVRTRLASKAEGQLALEFAQDRLRVEEAQTLLLRGGSRQVQFSDGLNRMDVGEWQVGDIRVVIPPDTRVIGDIQPGYYVTVIGLTRSEGDVLARQVQMREYRVVGTLEELAEGEWVVGGVSVTVGADTAIRGAPSEEAEVHIIARRGQEGELFARDDRNL